jgi:curved DNA-binding protein CbpA
MSSTNLYQTLGLEPGCSQVDIKKAYKKLALKYHPDKNNNPDAGEMFRACAEAYEILGDESRRREYDQGSLGGDQGYGKSTQSNNFHHGQFDQDNFFGPGFMDMNRARNLFRDMFSAMHEDFHDFGANSFDRHRKPGPGNSQAQRGRSVPHDHERARDPFGDPFESMLGGSFFGSDPFAEMDQMMGGSMFGGGRGGRGGATSFSSSSSSFSSSSMGPMGGTQVTTKTVIDKNGQRHSVRETTTISSDGIRHTTREEAGGGRSAIDSWGGASSRTGGASSRQRLRF